MAGDEVFTVSQSALNELLDRRENEIDRLRRELAAAESARDDAMQINERFARELNESDRRNDLHLARALAAESARDAMARELELLRVVANAADDYTDGDTRSLPLSRMIDALAAWHRATKP